jgi:hypothetical protein
MPVRLRARAVVHGEGTQQLPVFIPLPAGSVQAAVTITQFLGDLAIEMPCAVTTVQPPSHFPDLHMDAAITVIKPFYAKFRHIRKSTVVVSVAALFNVSIAVCFNPIFSKKCGQKPFCVSKTSAVSFPRWRCVKFTKMTRPNKRTTIRLKHKFIKSEA